MKIAYIVRDFKPASLAIIKQANQIIADYEAQGYSLTLRQLYYQFVSKALIPNTERSYKRLGGIEVEGHGYSKNGYTIWCSKPDEEPAYE